MLSKRLTIFTSFWFLCCLGILLLNDFFLKSYFHNEITGKLSDFAGLFVFSIFWSVFFKKRKWIPFVLTAILFTLWKSAFSTPFINFWNSLQLFSIQRVIDYTDLFALLILIPAYYYQKLEFKSYAKTIFKYGVASVCVFSFIATSQPDDYMSSSIPLSKSYILSLDLDTVRARLAALENIDYQEDFTNENNETFAYIYIETETCTGAFEYLITILETGVEDETEVFLDTVFYTCQEEELSVEQLVDLFERTVINQIE